MQFDLRAANYCLHQPAGGRDLFPLKSRLNGGCRRDDDLEMSSHGAAIIPNGVVIPLTKPKLQDVIEHASSMRTTGVRTQPAFLRMIVGVAFRSTGGADIAVRCLR